MLDKCTEYIKAAIKMYLCTVLQDDENPHVPSRPSCLLPPNTCNSQTCISQKVSCV